MTAPNAVADTDETFHARCTDLQTQAGDEATDRVVGNQVKWMRPSSVSTDDSDSSPYAGEVFDYEAMADPFKRDQSNDWIVEALDGDDPGTTGDIVVSQTQLEVLACMERAYRNRHTMRRPRAVAHMLARKKGHGDARGFFAINAIDYISQVNQQSRESL